MALIHFLSQKFGKFPQHLRTDTLVREFKLRRWCSSTPK